jgi:hypothetical protein
MTNINNNIAYKVVLFHTFYARNSKYRVILSSCNSKTAALLTAGSKKPFPFLRNRRPFSRVARQIIAFIKADAGVKAWIYLQRGIF